LKFFVGRSQPSFGAIERAALEVYAALSAWIAWNHRPWADEAQAWLIARDSNLSELFFTRLHYEGTPGLWHLILWPLAYTHLPYGSMQCVAWLLGVAAAWLVLRFSPFSAPVRCMLPFAFPFFIQTAIVARSYSLVAPLVFLLCILLRGSRDRPVAFAFVAGLLANVAIFAAVISAAFVVLYFVHQPHMRNPHQNTASISKSRIAFAAILLVFWGAALYSAMPAPDEDFALNSQLASHPSAVRLLSSITGIPVAQRIVPSLLPSKLQSAQSAPAGESRIESQIRELMVNRAQPNALKRTLSTCLGLLSILFYSISAFNVIAVGFYAVLLFWTARNRTLVALLPLLLVAVGAYATTLLKEHHMVVLSSALVAALWITSAAENAREATGKRSRIGLAFSALLLVVLAEQIGWTVSAIRLSAATPFDGSKQAADFIATSVSPSPIAGFVFYSVGVQPYFAQSAFSNQRHGYWPWSTISDPNLDLQNVVAQRPPFILVGERTSGEAIFMNQLLPTPMPSGGAFSAGVSDYILANGYWPTHSFCGKQPNHSSFSEQICETIYEPASPTSPASP
jgi:hypothetical protein